MQYQNMNVNKFTVLNYVLNILRFNIDIINQSTYILSRNNAVKHL